MARELSLIHIGMGTIGGTVLRILREVRQEWSQRYGVDIVHRALIDSSGAVACDQPGGFSDATIDALLTARSQGRKLQTSAGERGLTLRDTTAAVDQSMAFGPVVAIDCAAGAGTAPILTRVLAEGGMAVLSNKAPLALDRAHPETASLWEAAAHFGRLRYETTCGAGLPVISTVHSLLATGDVVTQISGTVSGTLGAIFTDVAQGTAFSRAVVDAKAAGYTEPDPRDDLSGLDVARKALILGRTIGMEVDLADIPVESLVPDSLRDVSVAEFLDRVTELDDAMAARAADANAAGGVLKYVASVDRTEGIRVGLQAVPRATVLGSLQGPENVISMRTSRYDAYPMTIVGPGAGADVTAAGVVGDLLDLARSGVR